MDPRVPRSLPCRATIPPVTQENPGQRYCHDARPGTWIGFVEVMIVSSAVRPEQMVEIGNELTISKWDSIFPNNKPNRSLRIPDHDFDQWPGFLFIFND